VVALFAGQMSGVLYLSVGVEMIIGLLIWVADAILAVYAVKSFNRKSLLAGSGN